MSARFEELDWQHTEMGELILRRRFERTLKVDVYEVKLGQEFLMSSLFPVAEIELARLGLAACAGAELDVVVGGLGLGYTAVTALEEPRVRSLAVVEALAPVISWHENRLLPDAESLTTDPRTRLVQGDFFALAREAGAFGADGPQRVHAVLLDIDHTPRHVLHPSHAAFYTAEGLHALHGHLHPGGVFALWSDDPPDDDFIALARGEFTSVEAHVVSFANPLTRGTSANTVYVAVD
jgi:spermidine synthase